MAYCPISLGNCSRAYLYIFGSFLFKYLEDWLISVKDLFPQKYKINKNIFGIETIFQNHKLIEVLYSN